MSVSLVTKLVYFTEVAICLFIHLQLADYLTAIERLASSVNDLDIPVT